MRNIKFFIFLTVIVNTEAIAQDSITIYKNCETWVDIFDSAICPCQDPYLYTEHGLLLAHDENNKPFLKCDSVGYYELQMICPNEGVLCKKFTINVQELPPFGIFISGFPRGEVHGKRIKIDSLYLLNNVCAFQILRFTMYISQQSHQTEQDNFELVRSNIGNVLTEANRQIMHNLPPGDNFVKFCDIYFQYKFGIFRSDIVLRHNLH